jgi:tetratricopeptide (TPR) repeat protein
VEALLGDKAGVSTLDEQLERLERLEWIDTRPEAKFQGERELCFRHALVREAAYGMLTEEDRALGHRLAGGWLVQVGEPAEAVIAEHFERGRDAARAVDGYRRAAAQALAVNDFEAVLSWTERAMNLGASGVARGELALLRVEALRWRGEVVEAEPWAQEAMEALPKGSPLWYAAISEVGATARRYGQLERLAELADELAAVWSEEQVTGAALVAIARAAHRLFVVGQYERAEMHHARMEAVAARFRDDPTVTARVFQARSTRELLAGNIGKSRLLLEGIVQLYEQAADLRNACMARMRLGYTECLLGAFAEAEVLLRAAVADAERMGLDSVLAAAWHNLGLALEGLGVLAEARAVEEQAIAAFVAREDPQMEGASRAYLARILRSAGDLDGAIVEARRAAELLDIEQPLRIVARGTLADVLLAVGQPAEALVEAREAMMLLTSFGKVEEGAALARLTYAEALEATGDHSGARAAIAEARALVLAVAARIDDPRRHKTFELARQWLDAPAAAAL